MNIGRRIKYFRELRGFKNTRELAKACENTSPELIYKLEAGERSNIGIEKLLDIAKALKVDISDLTSDVRSERPPGAIDAPDYTPFDIPVVGLAKAGKGGFFGDDGLPMTGVASRKIHRPDDVKDPNAYAVQVDGDSMEPFIRKGHFLLCETDKEPKTGDYVVVHLMDGQVMVKEYRHDGRSIMLKSINPLHDPIALDPRDVRAVHVVHWIKRS